MQDSPYLPLSALKGSRRRLAWLMDLYERNYQQLSSLLGGFDLPFDAAISRSVSDLPLQLTIIERAPYTLDLRLTYEFSAEMDGQRYAPDLTVKLYHDAKVAEALQLTGRPPWLAQDAETNLAQRYLDAQWQRNIMLFKWLEYLLHHGHGFAHLPRPQRKTPVRQ